MKALRILARVVALIGVASIGHARLDFTEGQMIPSTLKNDYTISGANTFSGANAVTGSVLFDGDALKITPASAQTIAEGDTITANACGTVKIITAAGAVTTNTTHSITNPATAPAGCCMAIYNTGGTNTITLDTNTTLVVGAAANLALASKDIALFCNDGTNWIQVSAVLTIN